MVYTLAFYFAICGMFASLYYAIGSCFDLVWYALKIILIFMLCNYFDEWNFYRILGLFVYCVGPNQTETNVPFVNGNTYAATEGCHRINLQIQG